MRRPLAQIKAARYAIRVRHGVHVCDRECGRRDRRERRHRVRLPVLVDGDHRQHHATVALGRAGKPRVAGRQDSAGMRERDVEPDSRDTGFGQPVDQRRVIGALDRPSAERLRARSVDRDQHDLVRRRSLQQGLHDVEEEQVRAAQHARRGQRHAEQQHERGDRDAFAHETRGPVRGVDAHHMSLTARTRTKGADSFTLESRRGQRPRERRLQARPMRGRSVVCAA